jgi:hypothetical protein
MNVCQSFVNNTEVEMSSSALYIQRPSDYVLPNARSTCKRTIVLSADDVIRRQTCP